MKYREFIYAGEPVPLITKSEHAQFLLQYQKSILASLKKREYLSPEQCGRCIAELEKKYERTKRGRT